MSIRDLQDAQQPLEVQALRARFEQVEEQLLEVTPGLPTVLMEIHKMLLQHEELVHLLSDEDIASYHKAFEKYKHFALIAKEEKSVKAGGRKKLTEKDFKNL